MGAAMCNQCTTCSEFCADKFGSHDYLQDYQKRMLRAKDLDRYDLFYRMVGIPFIELDVYDFFQELNQLLESYKIKCKKEDKICNLDNIPYIQFLNFYKTKPRWETII